jgi:hypothetical protein
MMLVKGDKSWEAGVPPSPELIAAIGRLSEEAMRDGTLVEQGGLLPTARGALVRVSNGKVTVTDGPFAETKEVVGGFAVFQTRSKEEALAIGKKFMQVHADVLGASYQGELEIREMVEYGPAGSDQAGCGVQLEPESQTSTV